jgi:crossover junction endodeoxyribonuclease RuvC
MGVDPGLANLGIGVVRESGKTPAYVAAELVRTNSDVATPNRLLHLHSALARVIAEHRPDAMAIESQFFHQQAGTAFKVGEAYGVALLAGAQAGLPVFEYGPMEVKDALVGTGGATKEQVIFMVRATLGLPAGPTSTHAADALAVALTHLASYRVRERARLLRQA